MVLPEGGPSSKTSRPTTPKLAGLAAAVAVLAGAVFALGQATAPPEDLAAAASTTTTIELLIRPTTTTTFDLENFTVAEIATGDRLSWIRSPAIGDVWPIDLVEHDDRLYLFTSTDSATPRSRFNDVQVWASDDAIAWHRVGAVGGPAHIVRKVESVGERLVALGRRVDDGSPVVWFSDDGAVWTATDLPTVASEHQVATATWLTGAAELDGRLVITGTVDTDLELTLRQYIPAEIIGHPKQHSIGFGLDQGPDGRVIRVYGPLGLVGYSASLDELGIDDETANTLFHRSQSSSGRIWVSDDKGASWALSELDSGWVGSMWPASDSSLVASVWNQSGPTLSRTEDGITWVPLDTSSDAQVVATWNGLLIGISGNVHVVRSSNGQNWNFLGTGELLPDQLSWNLSPLAAGPGGLAVVASHWDPGEARDPASVIVQKDGHTLTLDYAAGVATVIGSGQAVTIPMWSATESDLATVDFVDEQVTFHDPETGDGMVSFDFATLEKAEAASFGRPGSVDHALLVTRQSGWAVLDLAEEIGDDQRVMLMHVFGDRLVLVTHPLDFSGRVGLSLPSIRSAVLR